MNHAENKAFTLVELLVVLAITAIIASLGIVAFVNFSRQQALDADTSAMAAGLRDARAETLASVGGTRYGIAISADKFTLFTGATYDPSASTNRVFNLSTFSRASSSISTVVFERLTGNSNASGTIEVYLVSDPSQKRTIGIGGTGLVNVQK